MDSLVGVDSDMEKDKTKNKKWQVKTQNLWRKMLFLNKTSMPKRKDNKLSPQQERFCILFASDKEFFGNGVQSYIEAYSPKKVGNWYNSAKTAASVLLTKANITTRINELFESRGLNDVFVDKQLEKLITQDASFDAKVRGIQEYNKLRGRITEKRKHEFEGVDSESLTERAAEIIAGLLGDSRGTPSKK